MGMGMGMGIEIPSPRQPCYLGMFAVSAIEILNVIRKWIKVARARLPSVGFRS